MKPYFFDLVTSTRQSRGYKQYLEAILNTPPGKQERVRTRLFIIFYYLFIVLSMVLSAIQAPVMFIKHNVLAGWLWIAVFLLFLFMLFYEVIKKTAAEETKQQYETSLGTIITWVCIMGQWIIIFIRPDNGLYYIFGLMLVALGSIYIGWWARLHLAKTITNPPPIDIHIGISVDEARRKHFGR